MIEVTQCRDAAALAHWLRAREYTFCFTSAKGRYYAVMTSETASSAEERDLWTRQVLQAIRDTERV